MKKKFQDPGTKSIFKIFVATPSSCRASHNKVFSQFLSNTDFVFLMPQVPPRPQDHENRQTHKKITITPEKLGVMTSVPEGLPLVMKQKIYIKSGRGLKQKTLKDGLKISMTPL